MIRQIGNEGVVNLVGLSTDTKPTENIKTGSLFFELDNKKHYVYDEVSETWTYIPESGGGGTSTDENAVHYYSDEKTADQKKLARTNIEAGTALQLYSDGNDIYLDSTMETKLTFEQVKEYVTDPQTFVTVFNENWVLYPTYTNSQSGEEAIWFTATTSLDDIRYFYRIIINSNNEVLSEEYPLQDMYKLDDSIKNLCTTLGLQGNKGTDGIWSFIKL